MVKQSTLDTLVSGLERYFLRRNDFRLTGDSYDLVMLAESSASYQSYNLFVSAKMLDSGIHREVVREILASFRRISDFNAFSLINSLQILRSDSTFVKQARRTLLERTTPWQPIYEGHNLELEGELFNSLLFVRPYLLERLRVGAEVKLEVDDQNYPRVFPVRVMQLSHDFMLEVKPLPSENWNQRLPDSIRRVDSEHREQVYSVALDKIRRVFQESDFT